MINRRFMIVPPALPSSGHAEQPKIGNGISMPAA
jgi:hypothetical protein